MAATFDTKDATILLQSVDSFQWQMRWKRINYCLFFLWKNRKQTHQIHETEIRIGLALENQCE